MNWIYYTIVAMIIIGGLLFFIKLLSFNVFPLVLLSYQYIGSLITIFIYLLIRKISFSVNRINLIKIFLSGLLVSTGLSFYYLSISLTSTSRVVPLHNVGVTLLPALLAFIFLKEKITKRVIAGLACSVLCIIFLTI